MKETLVIPEQAECFSFVACFKDELQEPKLIWREFVTASSAPTATKAFLRKIQRTKLPVESSEGRSLSAVQGQRISQLSASLDVFRGLEFRLNNSR